MNKLKYLLLIVPFLFIGSVKAEDTVSTVNLSYVEQPSVYCNFYYYDYDYLLEQGFEDEIKTLYSSVIDTYNKNYSNDYKYYVISLYAKDSGNCNTSRQGISDIYMSLLAFDEEIPLYYFNHYRYTEIGVPFSELFENVGYTYYYNVSDNLFGTPSESQYRAYPELFNFVDSVNLYNPLYYFISNYNFVNTPVTLNYTSGSRTVSYIYNVTGYEEDFTVGINDTIYPMFSADSPFDDDNSYVEINLNDYAYVVLSLKDYNKEPFTTMQYVKGEYCVSGAYDYGLSSKEKYDSSVTDICTPYYDDFTPVNHYVLENDLKNYAIYYLKAHDTSKENKIRIDSSVFNIHYITEEEADNPVININGRNYSILPFNELPSNSIKNTEEGFVPGASEKFSFSDIFTAPLEFLKDVWNSIVNVFDLVIEFIYLLPKELQGFLIASFYLAVAIGLLKILL